MERVLRRGRHYERSMSETYHADLARSYSEFFYHYDAAPLLMVNSEHLNFAVRDGDFQLLLERIWEMRGAREFSTSGPERMYLPQLLKRAGEGEKLVALTCYDAGFDRVLVEAGVDILLVGDSLGMTVQGHATTLPVGLDAILYHTAAVARGAATAQASAEAFIVADLPFGSYQESPAQAFASAAKCLAAGANMIKLEGGSVMVDSVLAS